MKMENDVDIFEATSQDINQDVNAWLQMGPQMVNESKNTVKIVAKWPIVNKSWLIIRKPWPLSQRKIQGRTEKMNI